jgi:hypothetical protein
MLWRPERPRGALLRQLKAVCRCWLQAGPSAPFFAVDCKTRLLNSALILANSGVPAG